MSKRTFQILSLAIAITSFHLGYLRQTGAFGPYDNYEYILEWINYWGNCALIVIIILIIIEIFRK